ncbi:ABC transporter substrate-binding protein [Actinomadura sp. 7K534]|uniref:ABC transporter substrate-binding protein n=1 Tax=Actinomadura sp. 7K534 TaxID=2530366 RepID=UPI0010509868|nr:ABC transporter substrate-binding protein [Actinomadura sp. 7K534]TDB92907.1 ABC transporter substrate-binding protein [Actinomadura sp. 7K534]
MPRTTLPRTKPPRTTLPKTTLPKTKPLAAAGAACALLLAATACGGEESGTGGTTKIGVLTSLSGSASAGFTGVEAGVKARLAAYKEEPGACDRDFQVVTADDASTPQGALAATQKLVRQDDVFAGVPNSSFFFGAGQFAGTQAKGTPFVGSGFDGGEQWLNKDYRNLFNTLGNTDYDKVASTMGAYWKSLGGTKAATVSFDTASSSGAALASIQSAEHAGLERGYVNVKVPFGSKDVGSLVLGIKNSGADVLYLPVTPETAFAVVGGLKQSGVELKSVLLATGYGADLLKSEPAVQAAQGLGFVTNTAPIGVPTPGGTAMAEGVKKHAGSTTDLPSFSESIGWVSADLLLHGFKKAGCDATQEQFIDALRESEDWDAGGLVPKPIDFSDYGAIAGSHASGNCFFVSILKDKEFVPDPKAKPACGTLLDEAVKR